MIRVLLMLLIAVAVGCSSQSGSPGGGGAGMMNNAKKFVHATIYLLPGGTGAKQCRIRTAPQLIEARRNQETVVWTIVDACNGTNSADVEVVFAENPFENCTMRGKNQIRCKVSNQAAEKTFKYSVTLTDPNLADEEDPELEIMM